MYGIAGIVSEICGLSGTRVRPLMGAKGHRGESGVDVRAHGICGLRRQPSVAEESGAKRQPVVNADGTLQLTFDGRIYNFQALRAELESAGYVFRSRTDGELILHAYEHWDLGCLAKLRGAFAFGLWDARRRRLLLARDRIGEKPLYYGRFGGHFFFASELRALLTHTKVPREIFPPAIDAYLSYGYV